MKVSGEMWDFSGGGWGPVVEFILELERGKEGREFRKSGLLLGLTIAFRGLRGAGKKGRERYSGGEQGIGTGFFRGFLEKGQSESVVLDTR